MAVLLRFLTRVPLTLLYVVGWALYVIAFDVLRWRRDLAARNLASAFPDKSPRERAALLRQCYRNLGAVAAEVIHGFGATREDVLRRAHYENPEELLACYAKGQSAVLLTAHYGNWEWLLSAIIVQLGIPVHAVYKPQRVTEVDQFLRQARGRFGGNPIPVKSFLYEVLKHRREQHVYALVADQTPMRQEDKHWTTFLDRDTAFYTGADKIARILRAPVFYVGMRRVRRGHYVARFEKLAEPPYDRHDGGEIIERYARALERQIRSSPADWLWVHRKWKYSKPGPNGGAAGSSGDASPVAEPAQE